MTVFCAILESSRAFISCVFPVFMKRMPETRTAALFSIALGGNLHTLVVLALGRKRLNPISFRSLLNLVPVELRWLATTLRPVWTLHVSSFLAFTFGSALGLLGPLVLRWLIDRILLERDAWLLVSAVALLFLSYEGRVVFTSLGSWLTVAASQRVVLVLRLEILKHLDNLSAD